YTSLFAFNVWSIAADFWQPDAAYVGIGTLLLIAGLLGSCVPLWWRRDTATFLAAGTLAACAFYFLPTRAHERYLFPALVLLLPLAAVRARLLWPYVAFSLGFAVTLYFAFTRYAQNDLKSPPWLESTLFSRTGQIVLALFMLGTAGLVAWRLLRGEARLEPSLDVSLPAAPAPDAEPRAAWRLPAALATGHAPTRRDLSIALLVAIAVLVTRGYRLDHPRDMYFDEVYHARTAFQRLAQPRGDGHRTLPEPGDGAAEQLRDSARETSGRRPGHGAVRIRRPRRRRHRVGRRRLHRHRRGAGRLAAGRRERDIQPGRHR